MPEIDGMLRYKNHYVHFTFYVEDVALLFNGRGQLLLTHAEDVIDLDFTTLERVHELWEHPDTKIEYETSGKLTAKVYRMKGKWEYIARLIKWNT